MAHHSDPVSIHTLSLAAYNVLRDLNNDEDRMPVGLKGPKHKADKNVTISGTLHDYIRVDKRTWFFNKMAEAENFFKYANHDPNATLDFYPRVTEFFMWEAVVVFERLAGKLPSLFWCYRTWFQLTCPEVFDYPPEIIKKIEEVGELSRQGFRDRDFPYMMKCGVNREP